MKRKETDIEKITNKKLIIAIILTVVVIICIVLQFTPIVRVYWIKAIIERIVLNKWNVWFISIVLVTLHFIEKKMFLEKNEQIKLEGEKKDV